MNESDSASEKNTTKRRHWARRPAIGVLVVAVLVIGGFGLYVSDYYHAGDEAQQLITAGHDVDGAVIEELSPSITVGDPASEHGAVFYPGAKVAPQAYVPLACDLADRGIYCVIAKMPFNLAFFGIDSASSLMNGAPQVEHWWLVGHSLGGAMGAQYAADNAERLEGIALLGAYAASDLSDADLKALVIYGSNDGVLNRDKLAANKGNLPTSAQTHVIEGGNHADFGDYGPQSGDGTATISAKEQQAQTADAIAAAMKGADGDR